MGEIILIYTKEVPVVEDKEDTRKDRNMYESSILKVISWERRI